MAAPCNLLCMHIEKAGTNSTLYTEHLKATSRVGVFVVPCFTSEKELKIYWEISSFVLQLRGHKFNNREIQGDQKVSVHLMITIQKITNSVQSIPYQGQGDTRLTLTPSVIPNSN